MNSIIYKAQVRFEFINVYPMNLESFVYLNDSVSLFWGRDVRENGNCFILDGNSSRSINQAWSVMFLAAYPAVTDE